MVHFLVDTVLAVTLQDLFIYEEDEVDDELEGIAVRYCTLACMYIYINVHYNSNYASPIISYFLSSNLIFYCILHTVYCILYIVSYIMHMRVTCYFANWQKKSRRAGEQHFQGSHESMLLVLPTNTRPSYARVLHPLHQLPQCHSIRAA